MQNNDSGPLPRASCIVSDSTPFLASDLDRMVNKFKENHERIWTRSTASMVLFFCLPVRPGSSLAWMEALSFARSWRPLAQGRGSLNAV